MGDFGHSGVIVGGTCFDTWGAGPFVITAKGKSFRFEDSDRFGPSLVKKNGDISDKQPSERSPFWAAHSAWVKQGRRLADDKVTCIYEPLKPTVLQRIGGRHFKVIEQGDGDEIVFAAPESTKESTP